MPKLTVKELNEKFLENNGFNSVGLTWVVLGDTFSVKDELKAAGCKFNPDIKWHAPAPVKGFECLLLNIHDDFEKYGELYTMSLKDPDDIKAKIKAANDRIYSMDKLNSRFVGMVGDKIQMDLRVKEYFYSRMYDFYIYKFVDDFGNILTWKTGNGYELKNGQKVSVKGTVKAHSEYRMVKETILTRCKLAF